MIDDMAHDADHALGKQPGTVRLCATRRDRRASFHRYACKRTRSWHHGSPETHGTTECCIRSKSSRSQAHPFREGNGRTGKVFMEHVAERSRFTLDFGQVTPDVWNQASQLSRPDMFSYAPEPASLVPVFRAIAAPRTSGPSTSAPPGPGRSAARASYPRAATQATNQPPQTGPQRGPQARHGGPYMPGRGSGTGQGR